MIQNLRLSYSISLAASFALVFAAMALGVVSRHNVGFAALPAALILIFLGLRHIRIERADLVFATLVLTPFAVFWVAGWLHLDPADPESTFAAEPQFWMEFGITSALLVLGMLYVRDAEFIAKIALPTGLLVMFVVMTIDKFDLTANQVYQNNCRVRGPGGLPFTPAVVFASFALLYVVVAPRFGRGGIWLSALCLTCAFVVVFGYTIARGTAVGLLTGTGLVVLTLFVFRRGAWKLQAAVLVATFLLGATVAVLADIQQRCDGAKRFIAIMNLASASVPLQTEPPLLAPSLPGAQTSKLYQASYQPHGYDSAFAVSKSDLASAPVAQTVEPGRPVDDSIALRIVMWTTAIEQIGENPFIGTGRLSEKMIMKPYGHNHVHQQYLSWLIWFGVPGFAAGLLGLLAPAVALRHVPDRQERVTLFLGSCSVLPIALMFDSLLRISTFLVFQALFSAVAYVVIRSLAQTR